MPVCQKCNVDKPDTDFWIRKDTGKLRGTCKECMNGQNKVYVEERKENILDYQKEYREENKEALAIKSKAYRDAHKEERKEWYSNYYSERREQVIDAVKKYCINNSDKVKLSSKKYRENNKEIIVIKKAEFTRTPAGKAMKKRDYYKRKSYKENTECTLTMEQEQRKLSEQENKCAGFPHGCCTVTFNENNVPTLDHIISLKLGGTHTYENTQWLCRSCNSKKNWLPDRSLLLSWLNENAKEVITKRC